MFLVLVRINLRRFRRSSIIRLTKLDLKVVFLDKIKHKGLFLGLVIILLRNDRLAQHHHMDLEHPREETAKQQT